MFMTEVGIFMDFEFVIVPSNRTPIHFRSPYSALIPLLALLTDRLRLPSKKEPVLVLKCEPHVLREGGKEVIDGLSITFSEPMFQGENYTDPPFIYPLVLGEWKWLNKYTLYFKARTRFAGSTTYTVTIPAGTRSLVRNVLEMDYEYCFSTTTPIVLATYPPISISEGEGQENCYSRYQKYVPLSTFPIIFLYFDQLVDPHNVLSSLRVTSEDLVTKEIEKLEMVFEVLTGQRFVESWESYSKIEESGQSILSDLEKPVLGGERTQELELGDS
eukprot:TRINITY_DN27663_c0_g1_i1.p1 TRINITY_DN27663_c0_g1~~TRINITY_DN27663_c0_g1_i1.p1  ORF type:complete len:273 (+),score=40.04 TRINITY_DN27663_c0_g1_i1:238-1056(+)